MPPPRLLHLFQPPRQPPISSLSTLHRPTTHLLKSAPPPLNPPLTRPASHASQAPANRPRRSAGPRLGLKRAATELVVPGTILFRQRGTKWFPGENCDIGRDHTIFATEKGYVRYYREEGKWGKKRERKFIGVVFERGERLPRGAGEERVRRLGMVARVREDVRGGEGVVTTAGVVAGDAKSEGSSDGTTTKLPRPTRQVLRARARAPMEELMKVRPGYQHRESNWSIGRAAERAGVRVREYKRGDRFLAWRKRGERRERGRERRKLRGRKEKGKGRGKVKNLG